MAIDYLGFNPIFVEGIQNQEKLATLRYPSDSTPEPEVGDTVEAIVSHDEGPFAILEITNIERMTVKEILETEFEHHQNYDSLDYFNERMSEYYDTPFALEDEFILIEFRVVEVLE